MNILTTISYYKPHISGLTISAQRLVDGLAKKELHFQVLTSQYKKLLGQEEKDGEVVITRLPTLVTFGKVPIVPSYPLALLKLLRQADAVWIHVPQVEGLLVVLFSKLLGKRVISTLHCFPLLPSGWQRLCFQWLFDGINNLILHLCDHVVYYTEDYAKHTPGLFHNPDKSSYIYPVIVPFQLSARDQAVGRTLRPDQEIHIGFVGRVAEEKGIEFLLQALDILEKRGHPVKLSIVGPRSVIGEGAYLKQLQILLHLHDKLVTFLGELSDADLGKFYRSIHCLVLPSVNRTEAFGLVQLESMAEGTPVVASDLPGVRIPVKQTQFGEIVPPGDPQALAQAILNVAHKRWDKSHMRAVITTEFSREKSLLAYERLFSER